MKNLVWVLGALLIVLIPLPARASQGQDRPTMEYLRARVREHMRQPNVDQREVVGDFFALADACAEEGKNDEAISLYQQGLRVDPWRLTYQLKLARLLQRASRREEAVSKAKTVYQYAEQEEQITAACELLKELEALPRDDNGIAKSPQKISSVEIAIVPIGPVNTRLLSELHAALQQKLGIRFSVARYSLMPGPPDRNEADRRLAQMVENIRADVPREECDQLLTEIGLTEESLDERDGRIRFLAAVLRKSRCPQSRIDEFREAVARLEQMSQHDADKLLATLSQMRAPSARASVTGCLGVTEADIFARDYNFLFGWAQRGRAVISYHRYTAAFNQEPPNRPKLLERALKQGVSSTFFILGIPRCTSPTCIRAYPHTLAEQDRKTCELCEECKRALARVKAEHGAAARK